MSTPRYFNRGLGLKKIVGPQLVRHYASDLVRRMREHGYRLTAGDITFQLAQEFGFCYGVDRAIEYAYETREKFPERRIFLTGEIIHNPGVNERLQAMGIRFLGKGVGTVSYDEVRPEDVVLVPAFGVPVEDLQRLKSVGCIIVDTTCGSVLNVWKNVSRYARDGFTSLIHGKYYHEETRATASQALRFPGGHYVIVLDMDEAEVVAGYIEGRVTGTELLAKLGHAVSPGFDPEQHLQRIGCANQTTMLSSESLAIAERVRRAMVHRYGEEEAAQRFCAFDTICTATQDRQDALHELLDSQRLDLVLVIGGYNSSNTGHLLEIAAERLPAYHILNAACIESLEWIRHQPLGQRGETRTRDWLPRGRVTIGLTAGASTPDSEVEAVIRRIAALRGHPVP